MKLFKKFTDVNYRSDIRKKNSNIEPSKKSSKNSTSERGNIFTYVFSHRIVENKMKIIIPVVLGVKPVKCENERYENQENDSREEKEEVQKLNFFRSKSIM